MNTLSRAVVVVGALFVFQAEGSFKAVQFPGNGHYYQYFAGPKTWPDANVAALEAGGYLATITSPEENSFVSSLVSGVWIAWLGGFQPGGSSEPAGNWQWVTGEPFGYVNWNGGEPNDGGPWVPEGEGALEIYGTVVLSWFGKWNDASARRDPFPYIVEYEGVPTGGFPVSLGNDVPIVPEPSTIITGALLLVPFGTSAIKLWRIRRG